MFLLYYINYILFGGQMLQPYFVKITCFVKVTLCFVNVTLCFVKFTVCFVKVALCFVNITLCFVKFTLCFVKVTLCFVKLHCFINVTLFCENYALFPEMTCVLLVKHCVILLYVNSVSLCYERHSSHYFLKHYH